MPKKSNSHFPTRASLIEATFKAITGCGEIGRAHV